MSVNIKWHPEKMRAKVQKATVDGIEEWGRVDWQTQAQQDSPVARIKGGTMRGSLGVERMENGIKIGGGSAAKEYIYVQEFDRSLKHTVGKAGFIRDSAAMHFDKVVPKIKASL